MTHSPLLIGGCDILKAEVLAIIAKRGWVADTRFLDSALHLNLGGLGAGVQGLLDGATDREVVVLYGDCHPLMDHMLDRPRAVRVDGQNCIEMLIGRERFMQELSDGAYFLIEPWARRWREITLNTFGPNLAVAGQIFRNQCHYLLAVRTPCSDDFTADAEAAATMVGLPLRWMDVDLEHLDAVLTAAVERAQADQAAEEVRG
jgi:hypothetical protein